MWKERERGGEPPRPSGEQSAGAGPLPGLTVPKGGGSIRGIGEKFAANPVTGSGSMTVPIAVSPGRAGFDPQLSLSYDSGTGNGPFGFGWSLSVPKISRKTDRGLPRYDDAAESDVFLLSGAEDLVPVSGPEGTTTVGGFVVRRYRPRIEALFARIELWTETTTGDVHWRSISRENVTTIYGRDNDSRIFDPSDGGSEHPRRVFEWLICASYDDKGNAIVYEYAREDDAGVSRMQANERNRVRTANRYLKRIKYGNRVSRLVQPDLAANDWLFEVVFDYDEGHYEELPLDPGRPGAEQHRFVRASSETTGRWSVRPDAFSSYRAGFEIRSYRRCRRVLMFHRFDELGPEPCLVRATELDYEDLQPEGEVPVDVELGHQGSTRFASFIRRMTQSGYVRDTAPVEDRGGVAYPKYLWRRMPPLELEYSKAQVRDEILTLDETSLEGLPTGVDGSTYRWVDLDGEGLSGVLSKQAGAWLYKPNLGEGNFGAVQTLRTQPSLFARAAGGERLLDLSSDGELDVVTFSGSPPGFYERTSDGGWSPFRAFRQLPNIDWGDPNTRFVDLDGDGHADVLITEHDAMTWFPSLEEQGFGESRRVATPRGEEDGPRLVFADGTESVYLADMSGDGLTDLVRIRNGEVCYWPNLGHGRFGAKVTMDGAPCFDRPEQLAQARIRLADVDGSGTSDIIYLGGDGARIYFNYSGNGWSAPRWLRSFPPTDEPASVSTVDLLGNGTACLVWSSSLPGNHRRAMRYIDLMGGNKPHLLIRSANNMGAETRAIYAPSTKFYLADKKDGKPWITKLPFPVHVVERVETYDHVSRNRFVTRYTYHHGYFDGQEREFRGFGLVEQLDTEESEALPGSGASATGDNIDAASYVPPVKTLSWFHTGVYLGRGRVSNYFAGLLDERDLGEYFREPGWTDTLARELLLDDTSLPAGLTTEEEREACRALRGSLLRQEVYALDDSDEQHLPYTVTERNYGVRCLQRRGENRHAVFLTHAGEELVYNYERTLVAVLGGEVVDDVSAIADPGVEWRMDPRVAHSLTLEVDDFGNVLKSASIGYRRRFHDAALSSPATQDEQAQTLVTLTENRVTNAIDEDHAHRTPLVCETRTWELTGYTPSGPAGRYRGPDLAVPRSTDPSALELVFDAELGYEQPASSGRQRRLIEHVRTLFRRDDLAGELPLGRVEPRALAFETYKLALTPGLVAQVYQGRVVASMLDGAGVEVGGRYVHTRDESGALDADWWIPSGRVFYSPGAEDSAAAELSYALEHFFLACRARDPFHTDERNTETLVVYDDHDLLVRETRDALDNRVVASEHDYRVLQPSLLRDPNRNRTEVAFDVLGLVVGTAAMGKDGGPAVGDRLRTSFRRDLTQAELDSFFAAPRGPKAVELLDDATTRIVYDVDAFAREGAPAFASILARETHVSDPLPLPLPLRLQVSFSYSDGFGREIQKKVQAEDGPGPRRDASGAIIVGPDGQPEPTAVRIQRWVGTGWTVFNNKGKPVRQFEPYFTDTHRFEYDLRVGKSPFSFYDPLSRVVAKLFPDHTWEKVVFGPWRQENWDVTDTVLIADPGADPDAGGFFSRLANADYLPSWHDRRRGGGLGPQAQLAAQKAEMFAETPTISHLDPLGRAVVTVAHNRYRHSNAAPGAPTEEQLTTRTVLDIEGNQRTLLDAKNRMVMRYEYDMLGNRIYRASMEAGERWTLADVAGKALYAWDGRGHRMLITYDVLQRPTESILRDGTGDDQVVERRVYGESRVDPEAANLRGQLVELYDQAGVRVTDEFDFKGNALSASRQLAQRYDGTVDWSGPVAREAETYLSRTRYDALDRPRQLVVPHSDAAGAKINVIQPSYNEANLLERVCVWLDHGAVPAALLDPAVDDPSRAGVSALDYDAKGQRLRIDYDNGASTRYAYDPETFRLVRLYTRRGPAFDADCESETPPPPLSIAPDEAPDGRSCGVQNLHYTYDPAGNITHIRDTAQPTIYFRNAAVEASAELTYDALSRLLEATGREHLGQVGGSPSPHSYDDVPRVGRPHPSDGGAMGRYTERYFYDSVGNIMSMQHAGAGTSWTRTYSYDESSLLEPGRLSNRLSRTEVGEIAEVYSDGGDGYDEHGNMLHMPQLQVMQWDYADRLQMTQRQAVNDTDEDGNAKAGQRTWYVYDASGERARKVTVSAQGQIEHERIYLGGFEIYRRPGARNPVVRETLHVMDDKQRIALVEMRVQGTEAGIPAQLVRYQLGNHLGSASLELDDQGQVISYEEYSPYGSTTYQAVASQTQTPKRYRYTGMERDEESGLNYHGARYYAPWLGRWTACDPAGLVDGMNLYHGLRNRPLNGVDTTGRSLYPSWWDPAALADRLDAAVDVARDFYMAENTGTWSSIQNTIVETTATVVKGSTSILRVGTGAAQGVEDIQRGVENGDWTDVALGGLRIMSDAGEVAGAAVGAGGSMAKAGSAIKSANIGRKIRHARAERAALEAVDTSSMATSAKRAHSTSKRNLSERIGELETDKLAARAGLKEVKSVRKTAGNGQEVRQGIDKAYVGNRNITRRGPKRNVSIVEAKGTASPRPDPTGHLGRSRHGKQMSENWVRQNLVEAAAPASTSKGAVQLLDTLGETSPGSFLTVSDVGEGGRTALYSISESGTTLSASGVEAFETAIPWETLTQRIAQITAQGYRGQD